MPASTRRPLFAAIALAAAAALLAGCASGTDDTAASRPAGVSDADFPTSVTHAFGETTLEAFPERIVSVGLTEQDTLWALGLQPVGVTEWYGEHPFAAWPWAEEARGDSEPEVLTTDDGLDFEAITLLEPDLIVGTNAGLTEEDYDRLSEIAPTVAQAPEATAYFSPWDEQTLLIGQALGMADEAQALVDDIDAQFAAAAAEHPEFAGAQAVFLQNAIYEGSAIAYQAGLSTEFLTDLGFVVPAELDAFATPDSGGQAYVPVEQLDVLDVADVLIWGTEGDDDITALEAEPLVSSLAAMQERRVVYTDGVTAGAIYFTSPLSLPYVLDALVPALASAVAGGGPARTES